MDNRNQVIDGMEYVSTVISNCFHTILQLLSAQFSQLDARDRVTNNFTSARAELRTCHMITESADKAPLSNCPLPFHRCMSATSWELPHSCAQLLLASDCFRRYSVAAMKSASSKRPPMKCVFKHRKEAMASVMSTLKRQQVWDGATQTVECSGDKLQKLPYLNIKAERWNGMEWLHVHVHT